MNIKDKFQTPLNAEISVVAVEKSCLMWLYTPLIHNMLLDEISNGAISVKKTHKNNSDKKRKKKLSQQQKWEIWMSLWPSAYYYLRLLKYMENSLQFQLCVLWNNNCCLRILAHDQTDLLVDTSVIWYVSGQL